MIASLEGLLDSLDAAVVGLDAGLRVVVVNDAAESLLGRSRGRLAGRPLVEVEPLGPRLALVASRVAGEGTAVHDELAHGGSRRSVSATAWWVAGQPVGVVLAIGAPKALDVVEGRTDVGVLAAGLAHEIRNPLAALRGAAELIANDAAAGRVPPGEYTDLILKEAARMDALVGRILELGRPPRLERAPVPLSELLHELAVEARALAKARGLAALRLEEHYDPALPLARVDRARIFEALLNLVKNAVEAVSDGGTVTLSAGIAPALRRRGASGRSEPLARVTVRDDGPGLAGQEERLFTPFFTTKSGGTGLGLVLARHAIEAHGGVLTLREWGEPPRPGVEATVLLPLGGKDG